jgi:hypothetical protein
VFTKEEIKTKRIDMRIALCNKDNSLILDFWAQLGSTSAKLMTLKDISAKNFTGLVPSKLCHGVTTVKITGISEMTTISRT